MRLLMAFALIASVSCSTTNQTNRAPSEAGRSGSEGSEGSRGNNGRNGSVVIARGCEDFLIQTSGAMRDSLGADNFLEELNGDSFLCGPNHTISETTLKNILEILSTKMTALLKSGYFPMTNYVEEPGPATLEKIKSVVSSLKSFFEELQNNPKRTYGCIDGEAISREVKQGKVRTCFNSEIRYVGYDGEIETFITMISTRYLTDGSLQKFRTFEETTSIYELPKICENGVPQFKATKQFKSQGNPATTPKESDCSHFESRYSAIYPTLIINY